MRSVTANLLTPLQESWRRFFRSLRIPVAPEDQAAFDHQSAQALRPFVRSAALAVATYYIIITIANIWGEEGSALWVLTGLSVATTVICALLFRYYVRDTLSMWRLEATALGISALLYANGIVTQLYHYEPPKLVYFILILVIYAFSAPSPRWFLPASAVSIGTMLWLAAQGGLTLLQQYIWIGVAGSMTAFSMATAMRLNLLRSVHARLLAEKMAHIDALTGLPNRRPFFEELNRRLRKGQPFNLAIIDLDGFKPVNDVYGHSAGDALLIEVGNRLRRLSEGRGMPARLGGDEFALILDPNAESLHDFGNRLCETLRETYVLNDSLQASISASVGFVHADPAKSYTGSQLLERADYALYYAKQNLRGAPVTFTARHEKEMRDFSLIDQTLRTSDLNEELYVVFQPQYDMVHQRTIGFEALARWRSPRLGEVAPDIFIRAAERSGLISDITLFLLEKAFTAARQWPEDVHIAFNLSTRDLRSSRAVTRLCRAVKSSGLAPERIEFEITETVMLSDFEPALEAVNRLKGLGVRIALDDFGSGYSSLGYIHQLPVDKIKIDRSFVTQLLRHESARKIIKAILDLCTTLGLSHIVEGVETEAEREHLRETGARYIQGYLISRPLPADRVAEYLAHEAAQSDHTGRLMQGR